MTTKIWGEVFRVWGEGFRVKGLGFRVFRALTSLCIHCSASG